MDRFQIGIKMTNLRYKCGFLALDAELGLGLGQIVVQPLKPSIVVLTEP